MLNRLAENQEWIPVTVLLKECILDVNFVSMQFKSCTIDFYFSICGISVSVIVFISSFKI